MKEKTFVATIAAASRCLRPGCPNIATCRGLCPTDYQVAYQLVVAEMTTWEALVKRGKAREPQRNAKQWFLAS